VREVNALVGRIYRAALNVPLARFRGFSLECLREVIPFDAALWGNGYANSQRFHTLTLIGLDECFSRTLERTRDINPMFSALIDTPDKPVDMADLIPDRRFYKSEIYRTICKPYSVERALACSYRDARNDIYNLVALMRFERACRFNHDEQRVIRHVVYHLMNAASLAGSVHLGQVSASDPHKNFALCDVHGACHEMQPLFHNLIAEKYPGWKGQELPFQLPEPGEAPMRARGLLVRTRRVGEFLLAQAWEEGPLDLLTAREREIVTSVCRGLSFKEVARPLGIAPSTVSNHLYRVYEKLGVSSRTELAKLVTRTGAN